MNTLKIHPKLLSGRILPPPSKSIVHRAIICASLAEGISFIQNLDMSDDIKATISAAKAIGTDIHLNNNCASIDGTPFDISSSITIDCCESGSTLRFMLPVTLLNSQHTNFIRKGNLAKRPLTPYFDIFDRQGIYYSNTNSTLEVSGRLKPDIFEIDGGISSQFVTGLLFALPLLKEASTIKIKNKLESKGYIDITLDILKKFSIEIENIDYTHFNIKGNQKYKPTDIFIESDYSQAAFWLAAGILGSEIKCCGLNLHSTQGDKAILEIINSMNGRVAIEDDYIMAVPSDLKGSVIDVSQCPDLAPVAAVLGACAEGTTKIINAGRLRIKECDRLTAVVTELGKLGADIYEDNDNIVINGKPHLSGGSVTSWGDHRIAMALAIAAIRCSSPVIIEGCEAVSKSYPAFFDDYTSLGGIING